MQIVSKWEGNVMQIAGKWEGNREYTGNKSLANGRKTQRMEIKSLINKRKNAIKNPRHEQRRS